MQSYGSGLFLLKFWAPWCHPCKAMTPIIEEVVSTFGAINVVNINIDSDPDKAVEYNVRTIPTILLLKNGEIIDRLVGTRPADQLKTFLSSYA
jgi:thioredoxin 1